MADRRTFLRGLAALPAVQAGPPRQDPIVTARRDWLTAHARYHAAPDDTPNDVEEALWGDIREAERRATTDRATSIPGAIVALEWLEHELREHHLGIESTGDRLASALLDSALGVLRMIEVPHG